jgi:hypothetical protein
VYGLSLAKTPENAILEDMDTILKEARELADKALWAKVSSPADFPKKQGIYIIYNKNQEIVYVGKGKNLYRRINDDHRSGDKDGTTSTFRRKIFKKQGVAFGQTMRKWVDNNYDFSYLEIENSDMCHLVEALLISIARKKSKEILNS